MPNYKTAQKAQAKHLYFTTDLTQKKIAQILSINQKTMTTWVRNGKWAELKKAAFHSPEQEVEQLYKELRNINENINKREPGMRFSTKEELAAKAKIIALIAGPLKNVDTRRNVAPEFDYVVPAETAPEEEKFSTSKLHEYYQHVANLLVIADYESGKLQLPNNSNEKEGFS